MNRTVKTKAEAARREILKTVKESAVIKENRRNRLTSPAAEHRRICNRRRQ